MMRSKPSAYYLIVVANSSSSSSTAKVSPGQAVSREEKRALREQRISGVPGPFSSLQSLPPAFVMRSKPSAYYLIAVANSSSSNSAEKCQPDGL